MKRALAPSPTFRTPPLSSCETFCGWEREQADVPPARTVWVGPPPKCWSKPSGSLLPRDCVRRQRTGSPGTSPVWQGASVLSMVDEGSFSSKGHVRPAPPRPPSVESRPPLARGQGGRVLDWCPWGPARSGSSRSPALPRSLADGNKQAPYPSPGTGKAAIGAGRGRPAFMSPARARCQKERP